MRSSLTLTEQFFLSRVVCCGINDDFTTEQLAAGKKMMKADEKHSE